MSQMQMQDASHYEPRDPVELVTDHLIADVVLLVGKKSTGKSQIVCHWIAAITAGTEFVPSRVRRFAAAPEARP